MATTWIKSLHINKGKTLAQTLTERTDYADNPEKTEKGTFVTGYACEPRLADEEFMLSKRDYEYLTGRNNGKKNVIAYHIRQSFKPGETDAGTANAIGHDLAMSFTKGKHAFIVATHTDKKHIHNHIIFNSTAITCDRKFNDFKRSGKVVRRISDLLCVQYGLSIIEEPKPSKGRNYGKWFDGVKEPSWQDKLRSKIDEVLPSCAAFEDFIAAMIAAGYTVNTKRKHITFLAPGQKKPTRLDTLKGDYTEAAIRKRVGGGRIISSGGSGGEITKPVKDGRKPSLLIDIQAKIRDGKGPGYEKTLRMINIKESANTLLYLKEKGIDSYDDLVQKTAAASAEFNELSGRIKEIEARLKDISTLQKYIGQYGKTRKVFEKYKASGYDKTFYEEERADIDLHRAAKKYFNGLGLKKIPKIDELRQEYAVLDEEKKTLYSGYHKKKKVMRELVIAKSNCSTILGVKNDEQERDGTQRNTR